MRAWDSRVAFLQICSSPRAPRGRYYVICYCLGEVGPIDRWWSVGRYAAGGFEVMTSVPFRDLSRAHSDL